jgi:hypothetical protein
LAILKGRGEFRVAQQFHRLDECLDRVLGQINANDFPVPADGKAALINQLVQLGLSLGHIHYGITCHTP